MTWECAIVDCEASYEEVEALIVHQTESHERRECRICSSVVPDGYFAIRHALDEHTRAEYVRAYGADADDVRRREEVKAEIERLADLQSVVDRLNA